LTEATVPKLIDELDAVLIKIRARTQGEVPELAESFVARVAEVLDVSITISNERDPVKRIEAMGFRMVEALFGEGRFDPTKRPALRKVVEFHRQELDEVVVGWEQLTEATSGSPHSGSRISPRSLNAVATGRWTSR